MIPILNQELFLALAHAAHHPDSSFAPKSKPAPQPVTRVSTKNAYRIHRLRKNKLAGFDKKITIKNIIKPSVYESITQEITLARDVAHELYINKEISDQDWRATKQLLKNLSLKLMHKKEQINNQKRIV